MAIFLTGGYGLHRGRMWLPICCSSMSPRLNLFGGEGRDPHDAEVRLWNAAAGCTFAVSGTLFTNIRPLRTRFVRTGK